MIKYNINLKTIIPVLSFVFVLTIFVSTTNELAAQIPPKTAIYPVGAAQTPGGPPVTAYDPAVFADVDYFITTYTWIEDIARGYAPWDVPPVSAIPCQFPPMLETSNSTAMVVYKKEELGLNVPATINQMRFSSLYAPVYMSYSDASMRDIFDQMGYRLPRLDNSPAMASLPYNAAWQFFWLTGDPNSSWYYGRAPEDPAGNPAPVEIWVKNGAEFTERGNQPVDKSFPSSQGWVKVYDGYYDAFDATQWNMNDHEDGIITEYAARNAGGVAIEYGILPGQPNAGRAVTYGKEMTTTGNKGFNVTIPFAAPFKYTGGDITVAFVNPAERRGLKTDLWNQLQSFAWDTTTMLYDEAFDAYQAGAIYRGPNQAIQLPTSYRFRCYMVDDADVDGAYLGPKFQVGSQQTPTRAYFDAEKDAIIRDVPWPEYGLSLNYWTPWYSYNLFNDPLIVEASKDEATTTSSEYITPYSSTEFTYSVPATTPFVYSFDGPASVKPIVGFDVAVQSLVTSRFPSGADFKVSTQAIYVPGSNPPVVDDYQQVVGEFTVFADSNIARLAVTWIGFSLVGTDQRLGDMINVSVYRDISTNGKGDITTSELIDSWNAPTDAATYYFPLADYDIKLNAGENRFFFVFNLDESQAVCQAPMSMAVREFYLGNREFVDTDQEYEIQLNRTASKPIAITPVNIVNTNNDLRNRRICWDDNLSYQMISLDAGTVLGRHSSIEWYYSKDNGLTETLIPGTQGSTAVTVAIDKEITNYYCRVIYDNSLCPAIKDNEVWNITFESEIESVDFSYGGRLPHDDYSIFDPGVIQGDFLDFTATAVVANNLTVPIYTWELSSDNGSTWQPVGVSSSLSFVVPAGLYGTQKLRVTVRPDSTVCACRAAVSSKEFSFYVRPQKIDFNFVNNLPAYRMLCANDTITLDVTYSGTIDAKNSWWEKDGERLYVNGQLATHRVLKLVNVDKSVLGSYRYRVKARVFDPSVDPAPRWIDTLTTNCLVDAYPALEVFTQPQSNNYITPGIPVMLLVETSLIEDGSPYQGYQWYKHTVNGDVRLTDNTYRFGSTSNQLVLLAPTNTNMTNALSRDVYTFNGEYYYLQITGPCNTITTEADNKIYILPSEDLRLITDAQNAVVCELGEDVTYTVKANEISGITNVQYQWYIDGVQATDGGAVSGSQTPTLTIAPILDANTTVYCEVTATVFGVPTTVNSSEAGVEYSYLQNLETQSYINDVSLLVNLNWETNDIDASSTVDIYLNDNLWVTEELAQGVDMSTVRAHQVTIPLDDRFALLLIDNPEILNILVEVSNECGNMVSEQTSISVKDVVIEPAAPSDIDDSQSADAFDILPNPVNDIVTIGFSSNVITQTTIDICDLSGQTIANLFTGDCQKNYNTLSFNLNNLNIATGTYIIRISNSEGTKSKHFVFAK